MQETFFDPARAWDALPAVAAGLWLNIRVMLVCGVLIAVFGLALAVLRTLRGPVFFPLRVFAAAYTDLFRGLPLLLVIFLLGFGVPALRLQGMPDERGGLRRRCAGADLHRVRGRGLPGRDRVGPPVATGGGPLARPDVRAVDAVRGAAAGRRRVVPPLLNDLVSLQKDSGLIAVLGVIDAIRAAQIETAEDFNFTPYVVAGLLFVALTIPLTRITDWVARRQGWYGPPGERCSCEPAVEAPGVRKSLRATRWCSTIST